MTGAPPARSRASWSAIANATPSSTARARAARPWRVRQPGEGAAQVRVGPLAVAEDREGDHAVGARRHRTRPRRRGERSRAPRGTSRSPAVQQAGQPGDGRAGRVDARLGRERARDDVRIVGHRQDVEGLGDRRVQAGRRPGHLAHRARGRRRPHRARRPGCRRRRRPPGSRPAGPTRAATAGRSPPSDAARRPDRRESDGVQAEVLEQAGVPAPARGGRTRASPRHASRRWPPRRSGRGRRGPAAGARAAAAVEGGRLVRAQPEQLRRRCGSRRQVAGARRGSRRRRSARGSARASRGRPVVAVDQARPHRLAARRRRARPTGTGR